MALVPNSLSSRQSWPQLVWRHSSTPGTGKALVCKEEHVNVYPTFSLTMSSSSSGRELFSSSLLISVLPVEAGGCSNVIKVAHWAHTRMVGWWRHRPPTNFAYNLGCFQPFVRMREAQMWWWEEVTEAWSRGTPIQLTLLGHRAPQEVIWIGLEALETILLKEVTIRLSWF